MDKEATHPSWHRIAEHQRAQSSNTKADGLLRAAGWAGHVTGLTAPRGHCMWVLLQTSQSFQEGAMLGSKGKTGSEGGSWNPGNRGTLVGDGEYTENK